MPFVNIFYSAPSQYWWEEMGIVHVVDQGEGVRAGRCSHAIALLFGTE